MAMICKVENPDLVDSSAFWDGLSSSSGATLQDYLDVHPLMGIPGPLKLD